MKQVISFMQLHKKPTRKAKEFYRFGGLKEPQSSI